jgi:hypothetical protein
LVNIKERKKEDLDLKRGNCKKKKKKKKKRKKKR